MWPQPFRCDSVIKMNQGCVWADSLSAGEPLESPDNTGCKSLSAQTGQGEEMQPTVKYERGCAVLTGKDELLFVLEIAGSCQWRGEKLGLSSGGQHKCKVCRER